MDLVYTQVIYTKPNSLLPVAYFKVLNISLICSLQTIKDRMVKLNHYSIDGSVSDSPPEISLLTPDRRRAMPSTNVF